MSAYAKEISNIPLLLDDETKKLINNMQNGDEKSRNILIKHNLRLVLSIANKYRLCYPNFDIDDLISAGTFGLINAVDSFDRNRNVKLSDFAYPCIKNAIRNYVRESKMKKRDYSNDISLQTPIYKNEEGEITLEDSIIDDEMSIEKFIFLNMLRDEIKKILNDLPEKEKELLSLRYGLGDKEVHTLQEIATQEGITRERVRQKEEKVLKKLNNSEIARQIKCFIEE